MSSEIIKELVSIYSVENLLEEMETQCKVLAEKYEKVELYKSAKDYRKSARKLKWLRKADKFLEVFYE